MVNTPPLMIPAIADDSTLYPIEKMAAHRAGTLHQAVSVFVFCGTDLLIQKRALTKYHCGGTWANTCCTHPHWGESLDDSAHRRLREEMGFDLALTRAKVIDYRADVTDDLIEHERVQVYVSRVNRVDVEIVLNHHEVCDFAWASVEHLKEDAASNPSLYAPWFRIYLDRWDELGLMPE
jgi:isopentenyl-diphosphate Delta-isomerase